MVDVLSADGCVSTAAVDANACCPPPLCGNDLCCTFVAFFNLLPSGPLWDYWKRAAISYFNQPEPPDPAQCPLLKDPSCPSLILHAIYTVLKLRVVVHDALWVAYRESNVYTAVTTLDDHLARLRWEDCYMQHCRSNLLGEITPYEMWTECGPVYCEPNFPPDLALALKRNIAIALTRANMGVIKNLCSLNWVIDPLGAALRPIVETPPTEPECDPYGCNTAKILEIYPTRDWIYGVGSGDVCEAHLPLPKVPAKWVECPANKSMVLPLEVWPGLLSAECIIRSMMLCPQNIRRFCP